MSDLDNLETPEITQEDIAANTAQAPEAGLDPQEIADAANKLLGKDYQKEDEFVAEIVEKGNEMLDIQIDQPQEPQTLVDEPLTQAENDEIAKEKISEFDDLFNQIKDVAEDIEAAEDEEAESGDPEAEADESDDEDSNIETVED